MSGDGSWYLRFVRNMVLWLLPITLFWLIITPVYNILLTGATENLVRLSERPAMTRLETEKTHYFVISRSDFPTSKGFLSSVRVTDTHFPLLMLGAFFLAMPGVPLSTRFKNLGWALLVTVFFHLISLFFWVKFIYATQLDTWSTENYGPFAQNFWGLGKHLLDLPFKFGLPLALWVLFYFRQLLPVQSVEK